MVESKRKKGISQKCWRWRYRLIWWKNLLRGTVPVKNFSLIGIVPFNNILYLSVRCDKISWFRPDLLAYNITGNFFQLGIRVPSGIRDPLRNQGSPQPLGQFCQFWGGKKGHFDGVEDFNILNIPFNNELLAGTVWSISSIKQDHQASNLGFMWATFL